MAALDRACFGSDSFPRRLIQRYLTSHETISIVAEAQAELKGFILLHWAPHTAEVATLDVHPAWRRRGIGTALLNRAEAEANAMGILKLALHVETTNQGAIGLYQRLGFVITAGSPGYYAGRRDAWVMVKPIHGPA